MDPRSAYGEGKRVAELLCAIYHQRHGLETKIARCFAFVGPYLPLDAHFAIGNFIREPWRGRTDRSQGRRHAASDRIYMRPTWRSGCGRSWCGANRAGHITLGRKKTFRLANWLTTVVNALGARLPVQAAGRPRPGDLPARYVPSTARAREELGLRQYTSLDSGIQRTAAWAGIGRSRVPLPELRGVRWILCGSCAPPGFCLAREPPSAWRLRCGGLHEMRLRLRGYGRPASGLRRVL